MPALDMAVLGSPKARIAVSFWLLGLINNVLYVIILSAALDLVGPNIPKGVVLLADVLPSFLIKLVAPYFIHNFSYRLRVIVFVILSAAGMLLVALSPASQEAGPITMKMLGVAIASLSSGGGELSFLGLTHYYGHLSLAGWSSGTGAAGLIGAGVYVVATTTLGLSSRTCLLVFSFLPLIMLYSFFVVLPPRSVDGYEGVATDEDSRRASEDQSASNDDPPPLHAAHSLLGNKNETTNGMSVWHQFRYNLRRARGLFIPYMLPLFLVYIAEYTINQGVCPTLLFPLQETPFEHFRDFYPTYNAIYQLGVFVSRSSSSFFRIHTLYLPSLLQWANLVLLILHSLFWFLPNVWVVFAIIFWEGLLGGIVYVSTYSEIIDNVPVVDREFSLSATSVSDSGGICIAALIGMALETQLCDWQVARGRDWCRQL